jgi:hypothetical protein
MANTAPTATPQAAAAGTIVPSDEFGGLTDSMLGKYYCRLMIGKYKRPTPFQLGNWEPRTRINLPLPDILQDNTSVKYNGVELESVGDFINGNVGSGIAGIAARNVGSAASTLISRGAGAAAGALTERFSTSSMGDVIGGAVTEGVAKAFPAEQMQTAFEQMVGAAPNPNPSVAFQGPNLREFQLTWTFFPRSEAESINVHRIINKLKRASLPRNSISGSGAILDYPDMCQLNFYPWDDDTLSVSSSTNPWFWSDNSIIKIKKCVMNNVSVDYNASNIPGFFAGNEKPVAIRLSIGFSEIEYMLSNDWGEPATETGILAGIARVVGATVTTFTPFITGYTANSAGWDL